MAISDYLKEWKLKNPERIKKIQKRWMNKKGKKDQPHNKTSIRELGVLVSESKRYLYPEGWVDELKKYYRNIEQLR